ncbi:unnamed protein product [Lactuca saligna]|uniref:Uncharacterized protein n=1 Tax=Lactuca saligna TaxID=75948 RepID=A0AA35YVB8_LACSI|nr:unnamed protein product [Lactuca saligna]
MATINTIMVVSSSVAILRLLNRSNKSAAELGSKGYVCLETCDRIVGTPWQRTIGRSKAVMVDVLLLGEESRLLSFSILFCCYVVGAAPAAVPLPPSRLSVTRHREGG